MKSYLQSTRCCRRSRKWIAPVILLFIAFGVASAGNAAPAFLAENEQQSVKKLLKKAKKDLRAGRFAECESAIRQALAIDSKNVRANLALSYLFLKQRKLLESHELAYKVAQNDKKNSLAYALIGSVQLSLGNFRRARDLLANSISLNRDEALAWASLGMLDFYENRIEESILNLREATFHDRNEPDFEFALAQVSSRGEKYKEAAKAYRRFLRIAPNTDTERRDRIKGLIRFFTYLGKRSSIYNLGGKASTTVATRIVNNRPIVPVSFGRKRETLDFVLDTGSGITVLSEKTAKRMGIRAVARGGVARALGGTGKFDIVYGFLDTVRIGDIRVRNVPVYIRKFQESGTQVDGYIGLSLISKFITTIDYSNESFSLIRKNKFFETPSSDNAFTIPLRMTSSGFLSGHVNLPGIESDLHFILDTGASVSVVSEDLAETEAIRPHLSETRLRVIGAAGITENVPLYLLKDVRFGVFSRSELQAVALDLDIINETSGFEQAGILGGNFLRDYKLTFDFKRSRVTLTPN